MTRQKEQQGLDHYLTVSEAASFLRVSASTLRNWDRAGKLKARRHPMNGYRLYHTEDLEGVLKRIHNQEEDLTAALGSKRDTDK